MSFTHTGGFTSSNCASTAVFVGTVSGDCFLTITASTLDLSTATIAFAPGTGGSVLPAGSAANAGPWVFHTPLGGTYTITAPRGTGPVSLTVSALAYTPPTLTFSNIFGQNAQGAGTFNIVSYNGASTGLQVAILKARQTNNTEVTSTTSMTGGWTRLGKDNVLIGGGPGSQAFEIWTRPAVPSNTPFTITTTATFWLLGIATIQNVGSTILSPFGKSTQSTGNNQSQTVAVTASGPGFWFNYHQEPATQVLSGDILYTTPSPAGAVSRTLGPADMPSSSSWDPGNTLYGFIMSPIGTTTVAVTGTLAVCGGLKWEIQL